ncbi:MAG TPA: hypothetical protein DCS66_19720 [Flavobacteriaceae bacterium]|nr:hypothetical protein [Flavobacteriaceae bacterium]|tara:strand:+ start:269 stop:502 length:234 start_codon:yes stop_codon:yes gene_type:complete
MGTKVKEYSLKQLDKIFNNATKNGYEGTYQDFITDFGNVEEDFLTLSKNKTKTKTKKVATAKHGGLAKRGYGVARRG